MAAVTDEQVYAALDAFDLSLAMPYYGKQLVSQRARRLAAMELALKAADAAATVERAFLGGDGVHMLAPASVAVPPIVTRCGAQRQGDEMYCARCGLTWSPGDEDPPVCNPVERRITMERRR
jgi:hypothetical protein